MANLCAGLDKHQAMLLSLLFTLRGGDFALIVEIGLVTDKDDDYIVATLAADVVDPLKGLLEGLLV